MTTLRLKNIVMMQSLTMKDLLSAELGNGEAIECLNHINSKGGI